MLSQCRRFAFLFVLTLLAFGSGVSAIAQTITGSVRGVIVDQSGAVVAGATITARNVDTGVVTRTQTGRNGVYNLQTLPIGNYVVSAEKPGFSKTSNKVFSLEIDQIAKVDLKLAVGEVSTTVEVVDTGSILQTENATLGTTITANTLESQPLNAQNFSYATLFVPGAVDPSSKAMGGTDGTERAEDTSSMPSFNGNRQQTNNYIYDGADINENINNNIGYNPAPESLQQIRVITGNADAEYGNVNGGEVIMVTKGGTNLLHGSLYAFYENQDLTANSWGNNHLVPIVPKLNYHQLQFGATVGGPIIKNKLFFFADVEGFRNTTAGLGTASVATAAMRTGDFSEFLGQGAGVGIPKASQVQLYNTSAGTGPKTAYVNNQIPVLNPVAKYLFAHPEVYPLPNRPSSIPTSPDSVNYGAPTKTIINNNQGDVRIDYVLGSHDAINARFSMGDPWDKTPLPVLPITFPAGDEYPYYGGVFNEVHTFTNSLQNQFRAGVSRIVVLTALPVDSTGEFGSAGNSVVGIGAPQPYSGFSQISLSSVESNVGTRGAATTYYENIFSYGDDVSWLRGKHIVKFGAQALRYQQNNFYPSANGAMGLFSYTGAYTADAAATVAGGPKATGYGFADFVLDDSYMQAVGGVAGRVGQRQYRLAFYAQDDWKLLPNLTVNIGLRYGYDQPIYEVNNKEVNVDVDHPSTCPKCLEFAGQNGNSRGLYKPFYKEFMPRVGFAYQANRALVFRGGYGITDDLEGTGANLRMTQNAPFIFQYSNTGLTPTTTSQGTPRTVESGFAQAAGNVSVASTRYQAWAHNLRPALIQEYNLTTQVLLTNSMTFQFGYVGEVGQHLVVPENVNQYTTPNNAATAPFAGLVGTGGLVYLTESEGYSNYNSLQASVRQRTTHGLEYTFNYTFSKSMTNNPGFYGVTGVDGASVFPQNIYDPHGDYGPAATDSRNTVSFNATYELPFGHGRDFGAHMNRFLDEAIGGWKISGDAILYSGFPITITANNVANANSSTARANQYRPLIIKNRTLSNWFGNDVSVAPCGGAYDGKCAYGVELSGSFGTAHTNTERAPGYRIIDMSLFKEFRTYKEQAILFRIDGFNAFNIASYGAPAASVSSSSFGQITSALSPARQFQISAKYRF